jgi:hypothetical protein
MEAQAAPRSLKLKHNKRIGYEVHQDDSQVSVGGMLALGYGSKRILRKKRKNANCAEDTVTDTGSK